MASPTEEAAVAETHCSSLHKSHPGPKVKTEDITTRDQQWTDIGSGIVARTFKQAKRLVTTSRGGPCISDIESRKTWSLSTGKLIDECKVEDISESKLHRELPVPDDIRVELVLKQAEKLFERRGPDVAEIHSQPRVCQEAGEAHLTPGWSLDLTMKDPATGKAWDLSVPSVQSRVKKLVRDTKPYCIIGSPPCTPFSPLQEISRSKRDPRVMRQELEAGKRHIRFCLELYGMQIDEKRHFVHEHPEKSRAWQMPEVQAMMLRPEVGSTIVHMCAFGMTASDKMGTAPVKKPTRLMSSSEEVLKRMDKRCSNEAGQAQHRHVHLVSGRAKAAQVYPRQFGVCICQGIMAQKKLEQLGLKAREIMSLDEMRSTAAVEKIEECPSEALHETGCEGLVAFDDITGHELDPRLMTRARKEEIAYFKSMGVYEKVSVNECWGETGKAPIAVRWVDINKGDTQNPNYRSRLVAK